MSSRERALSLRWRLLLAIALPMIALFILLSVLQYRQHIQTINDGLRDEIRSTIHSHTRDLEAIQLLDQRDAIIELTDRLKSLPKIVDLTFHDVAGRPVFRYRQLVSDRQTVAHDDRTVPHRTMSLTENVSNRNRVFGSVQVTVDTHALDLARSDAIRWTTLTLLGFLLLSLILAYVLQLLIANPVIELSHFVRRVARDERHRDDRVALADRAELGTLAEGINQLLDAIAEREAGLEQLSALEAANQARAEFISMMNHEMRTPLNVIKGYGELLMDSARSRGDRESLEDLQNIDIAARQLLGLINDLLDLSKLEAGKMEIHREPVVVRELIDEVAMQARPLVTRNNNTLTVELGDGRGDGRDDDLGTIALDRGKVIQCLLNLLSNAAKFTSNGTITLSASRETGEDGDESLCLRVRDTGIGMNEEQVARIFQPYQQADASTRQNFGGTGLGLAICHLYCQAMDGAITVTSKPEKGSTFTITLPTHLSQDVAPDPRGEPSVATS